MLHLTIPLLCGLSIALGLAAARSFGSTSNDNCDYIPGIGPRDKGITKPLTVCTAASSGNEQFAAPPQRLGPGTSGFPHSFPTCDAFLSWRSRNTVVQQHSGAPIQAGRDGVTFPTRSFLDYIAPDRNIGFRRLPEHNHRLISWTLQETPPQGGVWTATFSIMPDPGLEVYVLDLSNVLWKDITRYNKAVLREETQLIEEHELIHVRHHNAIFGHPEFAKAAFISSVSEPKVKNLTERQAQTMWLPAVWRRMAEKWSRAVMSTSALFHEYIADGRHGFGRLGQLDPCPQLTVELDNPVAVPEKVHARFTFSIKHTPRPPFRLRLFQPTSWKLTRGSVPGMQLVAAAGGSKAELRGAPTSSGEFPIEVTFGDKEGLKAVNLFVIKVTGKQGRMVLPEEWYTTFAHEGGSAQRGVQNIRTALAALNSEVGRSAMGLNRDIVQGACAARVAAETSDPLEDRYVIAHHLQGDASSIVWPLRSAADRSAFLRATSSYRETMGSVIVPDDDLTEEERGYFLAGALGALWVEIRRAKDFLIESTATSDGGLKRFVREQLSNPRSIYSCFQIARGVA